MIQVTIVFLKKYLIYHLLLLSPHGDYEARLNRSRLNGLKRKKPAASSLPHGMLSTLQREPTVHGLVSRRLEHPAGDWGRMGPSSWGVRSHVVPSCNAY